MTSPLPTLILIHGIGQQQADWANDAIACLPSEAQARCRPFYWADLMESTWQSQAFQVAGMMGYALIKSQGWGVFLFPLIQSFLDMASDLMSYANVQQKSFARLQVLLDAEAAAGRSVILIGHSMGSVLAFEYLALKGQGSVCKLITIGSPLDREPVKSKVLKRVRQQSTLPLPWLNLYGTLDMVCATQPWKEGSMAAFSPTEQIALKGQTHSLEPYVQAIPPHWLS